MSTPEKEAVVQEMTEILEKATSVFVTDYKGLDVEQISAFRKKCREQSVHYLVVKNTLARIAAEKTGWGEMIEHLKGPSAVAYSYDDPSAPARVIKEFTKDKDKPEIKVSLFEGVFYGPEKMDMIASLPSKEVVLSQVAGAFKAPIQGFTGVMGGLLSQFVRTLDAVREEKARSEG
jgi:large subunit ribosomal protein L10